MKLYKHYYHLGNVIVAILLFAVFAVSPVLAVPGAFDWGSFDSFDRHSSTYPVSDINGGEDTAIANASIHQTNMAPVNTVPGPQTVEKDTPLNINSVSVTDVDGNLATTQLSVSNGTVIVSLSGSAVISAGANGSNTLTISGSEVDINATLAMLVYQGNLNFVGSDILVVFSTDSAASPLSDTDTVAITVNDYPAVAPVIAITDGGSTRARLNWLPYSANCNYYVYSSTQPYNNYSLEMILPEGSATYLAMLGTIGNTTTNYFYFVDGVNCSATHNASSDRVGEFDFAIIMGQ